MSIRARIGCALAVTVAVFTSQIAAAQSIPPPVPPTQPLTVEEAVAFALQHNPVITSAELDVRIARDRLTAARAGRTPDVGLTATTTYNPSPATITLGGGDGGDGGEPAEIALSQRLSTSVALTASQPLWPLTRWEAPITIARAGVGTSQEELRRTRQLTALQTRLTFYEYVNTQDLLDVATGSVNVARIQLALAVAAVEAGTSARLDQFQAEAVLAQAEVNLARARNSVALAQANLATQLGLPAGTAVEIVRPQGMPEAPAQVEPLVERAILQRPEIQQLTFTRQSLRANIDLIRVQKQPMINLQGNYSKSLDGGFSLGGDGLSFSAVASVNLFDGGETNAQVAAARKQLAQVDARARQLSLSIGLEVRQAWLNLHNAVDQLEAAQRQFRAADEAFRIAQLRFREGEGILLEVEQARLNRTQADTALAQARFQALQASAQLTYAMGEPAEAPAPPAPAPVP